MKGKFPGVTMKKQTARQRSRWIQEVLERYEGALVRYTTRLTLDAEEARDIVQEGFLKLCDSDLTGRDHVGAWLYAVCRNLALDMRRKEKRMNPLDEATLAAQPSDEPGPAAIAEKREQGSRAIRALDSLPENQREVLRLKFQDGLSYREISTVTGHSVSNVGFLIHVGLKTIREQLQDPASPAGHRSERRQS
jgi:RNA polymerase sigma-70 factor (ECF subfamily)